MKSILRKDYIFHDLTFSKILYNSYDPLLVEVPSPEPVLVDVPELLEVPEFVVVEVAVLLEEPEFVDVEEVPDTAQTKEGQK